MKKPQPQRAIFAPASAVGRAITFRTVPGGDVKRALKNLRDTFDVDCGIVGIGEPAVLGLKRKIDGLRTFPAMSGPGCSVPSTQGALWVYLLGPDRGAVFDFAQSIRATVADGFVVSDVVDTFTYQGGRDLTRFEDGTENPHDERAIEAAVVKNSGTLDGSSFVAAQTWVHDLTRFFGFSSKQRDNVIGRSAKTNEELGGAPASAHVKRSAQESFDPPAFMVRRSMPWASGDQEGLVFIAFGESLDRFERVMRRMTGLDDGIVDGLFSFSRPISGGYYWCPPVTGGKLDLRALKL